MRYLSCDVLTLAALGGTSLTVWLLGRGVPADPATGEHPAWAALLLAGVCAVCAVCAAAERRPRRSRRWT